MFSRTTGLFGRFSGNDSACCLFPANKTQLFSQFLSATFFAAVLKSFLQITTSSLSGAAKSNKSVPTSFAAGMIYLRKKGKLELQFSQQLVQVH